MEVSESPGFFVNKRVGTLLSKLRSISKVLLVVKCYSLSVAAMTTFGFSVCKLLSIISRQGNVCSGIIIGLSSL